VKLCGRTNYRRFQTNPEKHKIVKKTTKTQVEAPKFKHSNHSTTNDSNLLTTPTEASRSNHSDLDKKIVMELLVIQ
jgi:hypothetical protein